MNRHIPKLPCDGLLKAIRETLYVKGEDDGFLYGKLYHQKIIRTNAKGYSCPKIFFDGKQIGKLGHHIIWYFRKGYWPITQLDHRDGNVANNKMYNLREADDTVNQLNREYSKNRDLPAGVYLMRGQRKKPYFSMIGFENKSLFLGYYSTPEQASIVYKEKYKVLYEKELDL